MTETLGFIGLGLLGLPVATNLASAGYALRVYNRTASKADLLVARGAHLAAHPADAALPGGIVVSLIWDDAALDTIVTSDATHSRTETSVQQAAQRTNLCLSMASRETSTTWAPSSASHSALVMPPISSA